MSLTTETLGYFGEGCQTSCQHSDASTQDFLPVNYQQMDYRWVLLIRLLNVDITRMLLDCIQVKICTTTNM